MLPSQGVFHQDFLLTSSGGWRCSVSFYVPMSIIVGKIRNEVMALGSPFFRSERLTTDERTIFSIVFICK